MTNLAMGANAPITSTDFVLEIHLPQGVSIDVSALQLYSDGKVRGDGDMCFFNQPSIGAGAITLEAKDKVQSFSLNLAAVNNDVEKIVFNATLEGGQFSASGELKVTTSTDIEMVVETSGRTEAALILCEVYKRNGQWKIRNVSQGFNGGLQALAEHFGVEVAAAPSPASPSPSSAADSASGSVSSPASGSVSSPAPASTPGSAPAPAQTPTINPVPSPASDSAPAAATNPADNSVFSPAPPSAPAPVPSPASGSPSNPAASGLFDRLKQTAGQARSRLTTEASRFKNRSFMEAVVNGCVLVAAADGSIDASEKQKMAGFIERSDELKHFDMREVIDVFQKAASDFEADAMFGKASALEKVAKVKANGEQSRLLVRVVCAIGAADGDFDMQEKEMVAEIARELKLEPSDFGVS